VLEFESVEVGSGGLDACSSCGRSDRKPSYHPLAEIVDSISSAVSRAQSPGPNILLGGTDAFGHPDLPAIVAAAAHNGAVRIAVETDGGALAAGGNAAGAMHAGVRHVFVGFGDPPRALAGVAAWTAAAQAMGVDAVATCVIELCRHNVTGLAQTIADLAEAGAAGVVLDVGTMDASPSVVGALTAACDTGMVNGVWVEVIGPAEALPESHHLHTAGSGR